MTTGGGFDTKKEREPSRTQLRWAFLEAIRENVPGVLEDLWDAVSDFNEERSNSAPPWRPLKSDERLRRQIVEWGELHRITDGDGRRNVWLLKVAEDTARAWLKQWSSRPWPQEPPGQLRWKLPPLRMTTPLFDEWNPIRESRREAERRLMAQGMTQAEARERLTATLAQYESELEPAPEFRRRKHEEPPSSSELGWKARDLVWLAGYVIGRNERRHLAPGVDPSRLINAVKKAARLIEFELPTPLRPTPEK